MRPQFRCKRHQALSFSNEQPCRDERDNAAIFNLGELDGRGFRSSGMLALPIAARLAVGLGLESGLVSALPGFVRPVLDHLRNLVLPRPASGRKPDLTAATGQVNHNSRALSNSPQMVSARRGENGLSRT